MRTIRTFLPLVLALFLSALAAPALAQNYRCSACGTIVEIDHVQVEDKHIAGGAVLGAVVGGLLGNQVGSGSGRTAATIAGAAAGGAVGHNVQKNQRAWVDGYRLRIRMDNGSYRTVEQPAKERIYRGDRVKISNNKAKLI
jgi:outer membrane lipoprotein SlyB